MKRRKNAVYKGQSKRASTGTGVRKIVDHFYEVLNRELLPEDEIEIIPPEQVNPTHDKQHQILIMANYCVRKILPEVTGLFSWGDEVTPRLRALAPIVDKETADATRVPLNDALNTVNAMYAADVTGAAATAADARLAAYAVANVAGAARRTIAAGTGDAFAVAHAAAAASTAARDAAKGVYCALVVCIDIGDEATYNRIIDLTNEMLESL